MTDTSILLIQHEPDIADYIQQVLRAGGWTVTLHAQTKAGLHAAKANPYDVLSSTACSLTVKG